MQFNVRHSFVFATAILLMLLAVPAPAQEEAPPQADLIVLKNGPAEANAGEDVAYTVQITNGGQIDAENVTLDDPIPAGMTFVSATQETGPTFSCSTPNPGDPGNITCTLALLAVNQTATFTFVMNIPLQTPPGTTFVNIATGTTTTEDATDENNSGVAGTSTPPPPTADLAVMKEGPSSAPPDGDVTYTITLTNAGPDDAGDVTLTDTLPGTMTFVSLGQSGDVTLNCTTPAIGAGGTIECTTASFAAGATTTLTVTGHLPGDTPSGTEFSNTVAVSEKTIDPNEENNSATTTLIVTQVDLSVVKSGPPAGTAGQPLTYTIAVTSSATGDPAAGVVLADALPNDTTLVSFAQNSGPAAVCNAPAPGSTGTVVCTWEFYPPDTVSTFTLSVRPADTLSVTNTATLTTSSFDTDLSNNESSVTSTITPVADLSVTKDGPASVTAGQNATFTISLTNLGPSTAANVSLTDTLPANTTLVSLTQNSGPAFACASNTCTIASFAPNASATFTLVLAVASNATGTIDNVATASSATTDSSNANNADNASATVNASADLSVVKTGPAAATAGTQITWTINVANAGPSDAANVTLTDTLPAGTTFVSLTQNTGPAFNCVATTCTIASFASGATASFTLVADIAASTSGPLSNTATIASTTSDPAAANNTSTANFVVGANADLRVTKTGPATATSGNDISYNVEVANLGPSSAVNVVLTDTVPAHTTFVSAVQNTGPLFTCNDTIECTIASMPPGTATFTFTFRVDVDAFEPINNTANVTSDTPDPTPANGSASAGTAVVAGPTDLRITKVANESTVPAGGNATFTIDVINDGPATAVNTTVTDVLPVGTTFVSASSTQGTCTGGATVTCTIGTLAPGASATITLIVTVPATPTAISNTATVAATNVEADPANNSSSAAVDVGPAATGIPTLSEWMLIALAAMLALIAVLRA